MFDPTDGCPECGTLARQHDKTCDYPNRPPEPEPTDEELDAMEAAWLDDQKMVI